MGGFHLPASLGSKAAHLVSDITTVILNPLSEDEHRQHFPPEEEEGSESSEKDELEGNSGSQDGPDTSSFGAFLISLLSPTKRDEHPMEKLLEAEQQVESASTSTVVASKGVKERKGLMSRGKQTISKIINKAVILSGLKHSADSKTESDTVIQSVQDLQAVELDDIKRTNQQDDLPIMSEPSMLLSENLRAALYYSLPVLSQGRNWVLLYSTWRHGISLSTLYRRSTLCPGYSLLIIGDRKGAVFGGLVEAPLQPNNNKKYQGSNNCFIFTDLPDHPVIYRPTGTNHYYTLCSPEFLAFGGGGHFALYLDGDLLSGSSLSSDTFSNRCLAHSEEFEVKEVELWGFAYASKYDELVALCRTENPSFWRL